MNWQSKIHLRTGKLLNLKFSLCHISSINGVFPSLVKKSTINGSPYQLAITSGQPLQPCPLLSSLWNWKTFQSCFFILLFFYISYLWIFVGLGLLFCWRIWYWNPVQLCHQNSWQKSGFKNVAQNVNRILVRIPLTLWF